jgi:hypothetical protein
LHDTDLVGIEMQFFLTPVYGELRDTPLCWERRGKDFLGLTVIEA